MYINISMYISNMELIAIGLITLVVVWLWPEKKKAKVERSFADSFRYEPYSKE